MGAETTFTPEPIPDAALEELARAQRAGELTGLLLADPSLSRFRTLYPFLLWTDCPHCQQEPIWGLTEEVFLFNGEEGKRYVAYLGVMHSRPMSEPKERSTRKGQRDFEASRIDYCEGGINNYVRFN
jgi:hypothetical protein